MIKKALAVILFVLAIMAILAGFLVSFIAIVDGYINMGVITLSGQLLGIALVSLLIGIKLINSKSWRKLIGIVTIIFGVLYGVALISTFFMEDKASGMDLGFGIITISLLVVGIITYKSYKGLGG
ncbi:hypothetical protein [Halonatronum saccharophilum]|uniref:hypothetical protein n=1 Tax=Halonatronum saccharophilum TaxID=150060 RepID=UPI000489EFC9|nr:hypothetical protein [Halonatronum saccharophilum]